MKKIFLTISLIAGFMQANAQLPNGSIAPDFTLTDINGVSHNLYTYLDQGKTVFIDVSATWCGPCWNYHNTGALEDLWVAHGPAGGNGVSANTTNDVIVLFIEGDGTTTNNDLIGNTAASQGDWVTGVQHPIIDPAASVINAFNDDYAIAYFPTIYKICPNRLIEEAGQASATALYAGVSDCPPPASASTDVSMLLSTGLTSICGPASYTPKVKIQNYGTSALTSATVEIVSNGNVVSTGTYSGNLATYGIAEVTCSPIANYSGGSLTANVTTSGDANASNGTINISVTGATQATGKTVIVQIVTDHYGSETTWNIKDANGTTVLSGGPYTDLTANGTANQPEQTAVLNEDACYTFTINDAYGDGINAGYGAGSYTVKDGSNNILATGGSFASSETKPFKSGNTASINEVSLNNLSIFPNPTAGELTVYSNELKSYNTISLVDQVGRTISSWNINNTTMNLTLTGVSNGTYHLVFEGNKGKFIQNVQVNK